MECPDAGAWVEWLAGRRDEPLRAHLADCASCRADLKALDSALPEAPSAGQRARWEALARPRRLRYAWAAAALLLLGLTIPWRRSVRPLSTLVSPAPAPRAALAFSGEAGPSEVLFGATGEAWVSAGALARLERTDGGHRLWLRKGEARVDSRGDPLKVVLEGSGEEIELRDATLALRAGGMKSAGLLRSAWADESDWALHVLRGEARLKGGRVLKAGEGMGRLPADPLGWRAIPSAAGLLRERELALAPAGAGFPLVVEVLMRKRDPAAEAALVFPCAGSGWQVPLGVQLPSEGQWVRIRVELGKDSVRILAGDREYLQASGPRLAATFYACPAPAAPVLRVFGGAVEVGEARWRR